MSGPVPKRSAQRRRMNKPSVPVTSAPAAPREPERPEADPEWHPRAKAWFEALGRSGQSAFYEPSDWETAALIAESISRELNPQPVVNKDGDVTMVSMPPKAASVAAWLKAATSLLATEGDRRRLRLELSQGAPEEVPVAVDLDDWRRRVSRPAG